MADKFYLTITLRKEVDDIAEGKVLLDAVKTKMADKPDVKVNGNIGVVITE